MRKQKNYDFYYIKEVKSVRDLMQQAVNEAGDKTAFKYKEKNEIKEKNI